MKGLERIESKKLLVILPFVLTLVLLANVISVQAQNWDYVTIYQNQSATVDTSQLTPIGSHFVFVTTIGNSSLSAGISNISSGSKGFWLITVIGTGRRTPVDFAGGIIPWSSGLKATIDLQRGTPFNFGFVMTSLFLTAAEDNVGYRITIAQ